MGEDEEKTEEATPKRKNESRQKGQVARSQDLGQAIILLLSIWFLYIYFLMEGFSCFIF